MNNRILLINTPQENLLEIGLENEFIDIIGYYPPLGLLYLATCLKNNNFDVKVLDCPAMKMSYSQLESEIQQFDPFLVGITTFTTTMYDVLLTVNLVKKVNPQIYTVLGGHHPYHYPEESVKYKNVDFVLRGEGEETIVQLAQNLQIKSGYENLKNIEGIGFLLNNEVYINPKIAYIKDLNTLPIIDRTFLPFDIYRSIVGRNEMVATIMSSRGCPFRCTYCYTPNKTYRSRTVENMISEVEYLVKLGFKEIFFFDDLFALKTTKVIEFSKALRERKIKIEWSFRARVNTITEEMISEIKQSGVHRIQFGIESGVDKILKRIKKDTNTEMIKNALHLCKKGGITTIGSFIIGLPDETAADIEESLKFSRKCGLNYVQYNILFPLPFTEVYEEGLRTGLFTHDFWKEFAENPLENKQKFKIQYWTKEVSEQYLFDTARRAFKTFYFRPIVVLNKLLEIKSWQEFKNAVIGALSVFKFKPGAISK